MFRPYRFGEPDPPENKVFTDIIFTDNLRAQVHVYRNEGGEGFIHSHEGEDVVWHVLSGSVRFHDENDHYVELSVNDGIFVPADTKYWFEKLSSETLMILRVGAKDPNIDNRWQTRRLVKELPADFHHAARAEVEILPIKSGWQVPAPA